MNIVVILVFIATLAVAGAYMSLLGIIQAHYRDLGFKARVYGLFYTLFAAGSSITRVAAGRARGVFSPVKIAILGHALLSLSLALLSINYKPPLSYVIAVAIGVGCGLSAPTHQLIVILSVKLGGRNKALAIYSMGFDLGGFSIAIISGYITSTFGYTYVYMFLSTLPIISIATLIAILVRSKL